MAKVVVLSEVAAKRPRAATETTSMADLLLDHDEQRRTMRREILSRWQKFSPDEVMAMASASDVRDALQAKYGMTQLQAERVVAAWAKGRKF